MPRLRRRHRDYVGKREEYLRFGVREYWILDPRVDADRPALTVHRRRGQGWQKPIDIASGGTYTTRLLPDFLLVLDVRS